LNLRLTQGWDGMGWKVVEIQVQLHVLWILLRLSSLLHLRFTHQQVCLLPNQSHYSNQVLSIYDSILESTTEAPPTEHALCNFYVQISLIFFLFYWLSSVASR